MGLGGGFLLTHFDAKSGLVEALDAREAAPRASHEEMFQWVKFIYFSEIQLDGIDPIIPERGEKFNQTVTVTIIFWEGRQKAQGMEPSQWLSQERLLDTGRQSKNMVSARGFTRNFFAQISESNLICLSQTVSADPDKYLIEMITTMASGPTNFLNSWV